MHNHGLELWEHHHVFSGAKKDSERKTLIVVLLTVTMMAAEILAGWLFKSMALFADGWHMGTHAFALGISLLSFICARRFAADRLFTFGTWKIEVLGAYTSAIVLGLVGLSMIGMSIERILHPLSIRHNDALIVAVVGLLVNAVSAWILNASGGHAHHHLPDEHKDHDEPNHHHHDINLRSAYLHVIADALTSVLAIVALLGAKYMHWTFLDPAMGLVGAALILKWTISLLKDSGGVLLDREVNAPLAVRIREVMESDQDTKVSDLHLWRVSQDKYACIVALVSSQPMPVEDYKKRLAEYEELHHITVELNLCGCPAKVS